MAAAARVFDLCVGRILERDADLYAPCADLGVFDPLTSLANDASGLVRTAARDLAPLMCLPVHCPRHIKVHRPVASR